MFCKIRKAKAEKQTKKGMKNYNRKKRGRKHKMKNN